MTYASSIKRIADTDPNTLRELSVNPGRELVSFVEKNGKTNVYEFVRYLERAGESVVIVAHDPYLDKDVAIKFPIPIFAVREKTGKDANIRSIWHDEGEGILSRIRNIGGKDETASINREICLKFLQSAQYQRDLHSYVIDNCKDLCYVPDVYDIQGGSCPCCVMELIDAQRVMDWVQSKDLKDILELFARIVRAVKIAFHDRGLMHSDIKPDNILVTSDNLPVIIDFQHTKEIGNMGSFTHRDSVSYSTYSSEDHILNFKARTDRDDVHALCTTMWSMVLRYEPFFVGGRIDRKTGEVKDIWKVFVPSKLPDFLRSIFIKGTTREEMERYGDILQLLRDVEMVLRDYKADTEKGKIRPRTGRIEVEEAVDFIVNKRYRQVIVTWLELQNLLEDG